MLCTWWYGTLAVEDCRVLVLLTLVCTLHSLGSTNCCSMLTSVNSANSHSSTWVNNKNQEAASSLQVSANNFSWTWQGIYCTGNMKSRSHYQWFHQRMPGGSKLTAKNFSHWHYHFDIDVHLRESTQHHKLLSFLISALCTLALQRLNQSQGLTRAELHVLVLTSFFKLTKLLQNLMNLLPNHHGISWFDRNFTINWFQIS